MGRPPLHSTGPLSAAERMARYRQRHGPHLYQQRRSRRAGIMLPADDGQHIRITQLDGTLPNLALMKLSAWHKSRGDVVHFSRSPYRSPTEPDYGCVYGSAIFSFSAARVARLKTEFPNAVVGGTWEHPGNRITVEDIVGDFSGLDFTVAGLHRIARIHAAWVSVEVRVLRGAQEGRQAAVGGNHR